MQAFLKNPKLAAIKNAPGSSQKTKDKKQREKPVPWVEKVILPLFFRLFETKIKSFIQF